MEQFAKIVDGHLVTTCADEGDADLIALILADLILADGFKPYDDSAPPPKVDKPSGPVAFEPGIITSGKDSLQPVRPSLKSKALSVDEPAVGGNEQVGGGKLEPTLEPSLQAVAPSLSEPVATYRDDGERIVLEWKIVENSPTKIAAEIDRLKSALAASDYKVIQCSEYSLAGKTPPHDPAALHSSRQALRNRIGELEGLL